MASKQFQTLRSMVKVQGGKGTYSRAVVSAATGIPISTIDRSLANGEITNEELLKALSKPISAKRLDELHQSVTVANRGRKGKPAKKAKKAKKAKARKSAPAEASAAA